MILYRVGPGKWLTLQLFLFGIVSLFQGFQKGYGAFIATRFLLGMTESGFIPGGLWTLSTWYTKKETAKRVMFFYFGNQFGQASSKLLAFGILHMRGVGGKPGWFWLFALMGAFTILCGFIFGFCLPDSFKNPHSVFLPWVKVFNDREIHILRSRVLLDDPMKGKKKKRIGLPAFKKAVCVLMKPPPPPTSASLEIASASSDFLLAVLELAHVAPFRHHALQQRSAARLRHILSVTRLGLRLSRAEQQRHGGSRSVPADPGLLDVQLRVGSLVGRIQVPSGAARAD